MSADADGPAAVQGSTPRFARIALFLALAIYVALRAGILVQAFDSVAMSMYELHPMGTLSWLMLTGTREIPLHAFYDNAGGQLLSAVLTVPLFALFGSSYLVLKLVPALLGAGALVVLWRLLERHVGPRAAALGALLFALGPATLVKYSLKSSGNHFENLFFTLLALAVASGALAAGSGRARRLAGAGAALGAAVAVFLGALLPLALLVGVHLGLVGWRRFAREMLPWLGGLAIGLAPLIVLNLTSGARGVGFLSAKFASEATRPDAGQILGRAFEFLFVDLFAAPTFPSVFGVPGWVANVLFLALFALALGALLPETARAAGRLMRGALTGGALPAGTAARPGELGSYLLVPLVLYVPLTALAFGASDLRLGGYGPPLEAGGYRYYLPTLLIGVILIAFLVERWWQVRPFSARAVAALALALGAVDLALLRPVGVPNAGLHYEGHFQRQLGRTLMGRRQNFDLETKLRQAEALPPIARARVYEGLGYYRFLVARVEGDLIETPRETIVQGIAAERLADVWRGAGADLRSSLLDQRFRGPALRLIERWAEEDPWVVERLVEGACGNWDMVPSMHLAAHLDETRRVTEVLAASHPQAVARGRGIESGRRLRRGMGRELPQLWEVELSLSPELRGEYLRGLGIGLADGDGRAGLGQAPAYLAGREPGVVFDGWWERWRELSPEGIGDAARGVEAELPEDWRVSWAAARSRAQ